MSDTTTIVPENNPVIPVETKPAEPIIETKSEPISEESSRKAPPPKFPVKKEEVKVEPPTEVKEEIKSEAPTDGKAPQKEGESNEQYAQRVKYSTLERDNVKNAERLIQYEKDKAEYEKAKEALRIIQDEYLNDPTKFNDFASVIKQKRGVDLKYEQVFNIPAEKQVVDLNQKVEQNTKIGIDNTRELNFFLAKNPELDLTDTEKEELKQGKKPETVAKKEETMGKFMDYLAKTGTLDYYESVYRMTRGEAMDFLYRNWTPENKQKEIENARKEGEFIGKQNALVKGTGLETGGSISSSTTGTDSIDLALLNKTDQNIYKDVVKRDKKRAERFYYSRINSKK